VTFPTSYQTCGLSVGLPRGFHHRFWNFDGGGGITIGDGTRGLTDPAEWVDDPSRVTLSVSGPSGAPRKLQFPITLHELSQGSGIPYWGAAASSGARTRAARSQSGSARTPERLTAQPSSASFRPSSPSDLGGHSGTLAQPRGLTPRRSGSDVVDSTVLEADVLVVAQDPAVRVSWVTPDDTYWRPSRGAHFLSRYAGPNPERPAPAPCSCQSEDRGSRSERKPRSRHARSDSRGARSGVIPEHWPSRRSSTLA
jgi:hypothetical protein